MYRQFNIQQFCGAAKPNFCRLQSATVTGRLYWFIEGSNIACWYFVLMRFEAVRLSEHGYRAVTGHEMRLTIQLFCLLPTHCIYVFCVDLRTNSHYFPIQH